MRTTVLLALAAGAEAFVGPSLGSPGMMKLQTSLKQATSRPSVSSQTGARPSMLVRGNLQVQQRASGVPMQQTGSNYMEQLESGKVKTLSSSSPLAKTATVIRGVGDQSFKLGKATPSLLTFCVLNILMTRLFKTIGLGSVPPPLVGMFLLTGTLLALPDKAADGVVSFFKPATDLITRFLPMFFVPALIVLPLSASSLAGADCAKTLACILLGLVGCYSSTAMVTLGLQSLAPPKAAIADTSAPLPGFSPFLENMMAALVVITGAAATKMPEVAPVFMLLTTVFSFVFGSRLPRLLPSWASTVWHPLMSCFCMATAIFYAFAAAAGTTLNAVLSSYLIPGGAPLAAAGNAIMFWLAPAIWSFAFGLYARRAILFANLVPVIGGTVWAAISGIFGMATLNRLIAPSAALKLATLPRATAALAVVQAGMIGASPSLVTAGCVLTGMLGAIFGKVILDALKVKSPCARGVATGGAAFSLGAAALAKDDPDAFPFGALSMALMSTWATLMFAVPTISTKSVAIATGSSVVAKKAASKRSIIPPKKVTKPAAKKVVKKVVKKTNKNKDAKKGMFGFVKSTQNKK